MKWLRALMRQTTLSAVSNSLGLLSVSCAAGTLAGSFAVEHEYAEAFWLGAFTTTLMGAAMFLSFAKVTVARELHALEVRRREGDEKLRQLVAGSPALIAYVDRDRRYQITNESFEQWFGVSEASARGRHVHEVLGDEQYNRLEPRLDKVLGGESSRFERTIERDDGTSHHLDTILTPHVGADGGVLGFFEMAIDVSDARDLANKLSHQARYDPLTGLVNRRVLEQGLEHALSTARSGDARHALCYVDLDQFKVINDTCGHIAGDECLRQVGARLTEKVRRGDTVARMGGDEFAVLMEHCRLDQAERLAEELCRTFDEHRFEWSGSAFAVSLSIGVAPVDSDSESITSILSAADSACYAAKESGRNRVRVFRHDDIALTRQRTEMQWVARIQSALDEGRLHLYYQGITPADAPPPSLQEGPTRVELLLRLRDESGEIITPSDFLPAAERYNLATRIDRFVIETALDWLAARPQVCERLEMCAINLSGHSIADDGFRGFVIECFRRFPVPPRLVCFEVTETAAIANLVNATQFITALKALGCRFALDDFGSGVSSFAYLRALQVDFLKIDGMFVREAAHNPVDRAVVRSIHDIGKVMAKQTVAECVESEEIASTVAEIGVDFSQGYHVDRPRPIEELERPGAHDPGRSDS